MRSALLSLLAITCAATGQTAEDLPRDAGGYQAPTIALERGRAVYVLNHCHFCHGEDLTRANMGAANLTTSPLVGADVDGNAIGALAKAGLPNLQTAMPSYRDLTPGQIVDLARYIHYLRQQARYNVLMTSGAPAGDATRGRKYFTDTGGCAACHEGAHGLAGVSRKLDANALRSRMLRPGPSKPMEGVEPTEGQAAHLRLLEIFSPGDVEDLLAYLRELN